MHSNFVTPPDFVDNDLPTVFLIDASWDDVENLALFCQTSKHCYNVYLYNDIMFDEEWFEEAARRSQTIIMNSEKSGCTPQKNKLLKDSRTWYYGPNHYLGNNQQLKSPIDYFIKNNE